MTRAREVSKLITATGDVGIADKIVHTGDTNTAIRFSSNDTFTVETAGSEALRVDSSRNVGIGISTAAARLTVKGSSSSITGQFLQGGNTVAERIIIAQASSGNNFGAYVDSSNVRHLVTGQNDALTTDGNFLALHTSSGSERLRIDSSGRLLVGATTEGQPDADNFTVEDSGNCGISIRSGTTSKGNIFFSDGTSGSAEYRGAVRYYHNDDALIFYSSSSERLRIDSAGRLLVGATSGTTEVAAKFQARAGTAAAQGTIMLSRGAANPTNAQTIGEILFTDLNEGQGAKIQAVPEANWASNDYPCRLAFFTTADNASSPTERMRIKNDGVININTTNNNPPVNSVIGTAFRVDGSINTATSGTKALTIGLNASDGTLIEFRQAGTAEGSITVSGSTVSYNGGHLSRWSQLASGGERTEILRGSVLSNLDEMCEWGEEDNEQLNRMKVSDVEGDRNVAGVFQDWDDDDDTYVNDFYCAMTGDFVIRIAQGTTVVHGDLLMSAGDGTAKPQDDDIIRSKTIAKVTSTTVSKTYSDNSYCVPCVLMAC